MAPGDGLLKHESTVQGKGPRLPLGRWIVWVVVVSLIQGCFPLSAAGQLQGEASPASLLGPRGLSLGFGARHLNQADDLVSPLRYSGTSWTLSLGADLSTPRSLRAFQVSYAGARLTSSVSEAGEHEQEGDWVDVRALYLRRVKALGGGKFNFLLGGGVTARAALYEHWYTADDKETWTHFFGLVEPGLGWHFQLPGGGVLWQEMTVPIMGVVVRPPYQGLTEVPTPEWAGPGGVQGIHQALHYQRPAGARFRWGVTYTFEGLRYSDPRSLAWSRHALVLQVFFLGGKG